MVILMAILFSVNNFAAPVNDVVSNGSATQNKIQELTRLLENRNKLQVSLQNEVDQLSQTISTLTGKNDLLNYKLSKIETRQRDILLSISDLQSPKKAIKGQDAPIKATQKEQSAYQVAIDFILKSKDYDKAISAFTAFVTDYPKSALVANSYYWLGQLYNKKQKFTQSQKYFSTVVSDFPKSPKRSDALFQVGLINEKLGYLKSAKKSYRKLLKEYPNSSPANLASKRLQELK